MPLILTICGIINIHVYEGNLMEFVLLAGWLEPMLDRIASNRSNVVMPVFDAIDSTNFKYHYQSVAGLSVNGFTWDLSFSFTRIPDRERQRVNNSLYLPIRYTA